MDIFVSPEERKRFSEKEIKIRSLDDEHQQLLNEKLNIQSLDDDDLQRSQNEEDTSVSFLPDLSLPSDELDLTSALAKLVARDLYSDTVFRVGKASKQQCIPAHRVLLASASELFEAMLYPSSVCENEKKSTEIPKKLEISLSNVEADSFKLMLQCIYTGTCSITASNFLDLDYLARRFQVFSLTLSQVYWLGLPRFQS